jgi:hypothetical protein
MHLNAGIFRPIASSSPAALASGSLELLWESVSGDHRALAIRTSRMISQIGTTSAAPKRR